MRSITGSTSLSKKELHMSFTICCSSLKSSGIKVSKGELFLYQPFSPLRACAFSVDALIENSLVDEESISYRSYRIRVVIPLTDVDPVGGNSFQRLVQRGFGQLHRLFLQPQRLPGQVDQVDPAVRRPTARASPAAASPGCLPAFVMLGLSRKVAVQSSCWLFPSSFHK